MKKCVLIWDDDICWEEQLKRELAKEKITTEEIDSLRILNDKICNNGKYSALIIALEQLIQEHMEERFNAWITREEFFASNHTGVLKDGHWCTCLQELCGQMDIPVYLVAVQEDILQEMAAFEAGVADYFWREKDIRAVAARIKAGICIREKVSVNAGMDVREEALTHTVYIEKHKIVLTELEFHVFHCLLQNVGQIVLRERIFEEIWQKKDTKNIRVVDTIVKQLRRKLKETQFVILSKYKLGYLLEQRKYV